MKKASTIIALSFITSFSTHAAYSPLVGSWLLISYKVESQETHKFVPAMGENPTGRVIFTADNRVSFVMTGDNRKTGTSDADKAKLLDSLISYTGKWSIKGNQWCTEVEAAWNPAWVGTTQCREFVVKGDRAYVQTPWRKMPNWPGMTRSIITFKKDL